MIEALHLNISRNIASSEADIAKFCNLFTSKSIKKKEFLLREGEVCKFEAFVTKGLFKIYHIDIKGAEQIFIFRNGRLVALPISTALPIKRLFL